MKAAIFKNKGVIELGERPDPTIKEPADAVVRVALTCVCGSDLWFYRGQSEYTPGSPIGHEFLGVVEQVGDSVKDIAKGDLVKCLLRLCHSLRQLMYRRLHQKAICQLHHFFCLGL